MDNPTQSWRQLPFVKLLSSLKFGVTMIGLVLAYACVMSALPQVRGAVEMTEMQAFSHWVFATLVIVLCLSVVVATLARIRFNLLNAGVLTVHVGILTLCFGALWYFGGKVEGDLLLPSPRIELISTSGQPRAIASLLPEEGNEWASVMPAFGGNVSLSIVKTRIGPNGALVGATVRAQLGAAAPVTFDLATDTTPIRQLGDKLLVRLQTSPPERFFYDHERPALYVRSPGADGRGLWKSAEIVGLPLFRERYLDEGYVLADSEGHEFPSKRVNPAVNLGPFSIPTGWFEQWRMPIRVPVPDVPFDIDITGFVPYAMNVDTRATTGGDKLFPAIQLKLSIPGTTQKADRSLFAMDPIESLLPLTTPIEFRWANSIVERDALLAPMVGADELLIEVKDPPISKRVSIKANQTIEVEGTSYKITVQQLFPNWPLMSPGFENSSSPAVLVAVDRGDLHYTRNVIQRFPDLTQDIDETGMRRKEGPYDPNLVLRYRTATKGWFMIVCDPESLAAGRCEAGVFDTSGHVERQTLLLQKPTHFTLPSAHLEVTLAQLIEKARHMDLPVIEPLERRRPNIAARGASAVRLKFTGKDQLAGWSDSQWCLFADYPGITGKSIQIAPPGRSEVWELEYSRLQHDIGAQLTPGKLTVKFQPGKQRVDSWRSDFFAQADGADRPTPAVVLTNLTYSIGQWTLFQSGAAPDHWSFTVLGVGNRRGIWPMALGCMMIPLGCLYAFYVKPALKRRRQEQALATHAAGGNIRKARDLTTAAAARTGSEPC